MIKPLHNADYVVSPEGTVELRGLTPGKRVHVVVVEDGEVAGSHQEWGPGAIPGSRIYRPDLPRKEWGSLASLGITLDDPSEPACDPDDWEANR